MFFSQFFLGFFRRGGGGGGALKLRSYCRNFSAFLIYQENMHFSLFEKQLHKNLAFVTSKLRIKKFVFGTCICSTCWDQSFSELVVILPDYALRISLGTFSILLSSSYRWRVRQCSELRCTHMYVIWPSGVFIYLLEGNCSMLGHRIPPKYTELQWINT